MSQEEIKFGHWTVLAWANGPKAFCRCVCGKERLVVKTQLSKGKSKSCGCKRQSTLRHGYTRVGKVKAEWQAWNHMKQRCYNPKDKHYHDYGARGITVCEEWRNSFDTFLADMGDKPSPKHSLDRIDYNLHYCKENCRWATPMEQSQNRRTVVNITYQGETKCMAEWSRHFGINRRTIAQRYKKGWSLEDVFSPIIKQESN